MHSSFYTCLFLLLLPLSSWSQNSYDWEAISGGRAEALELKSVQNNVFVGYLKGKDRYTYSLDFGQTWITLADRIDEEPSDLIEVTNSLEAIYLVFWKRIYKWDLLTQEVSLHLDQPRRIQNVITRDEDLFFLKMDSTLGFFYGSLNVLPADESVSTASSHSNFDELLSYDGHFFMRNRIDSTIIVVDEQFNIISPRQKINLHRNTRLHAFGNKLYNEISNEVYESSDLGQTWSRLQNIPTISSAKFSKGTIAGIKGKRIVAYDLTSQALLADQEMPTEDTYFSGIVHNANGLPIAYGYRTDLHYKVNPGSVDVLPTLFDNPSIKRVIALDANNAFFECNSPYAYFESNRNWQQTHNFKDVHLNTRNDLIATLNDTVYISIDGGQSFTSAPATNPVITGNIRPDTNGRLYVFNEDYYCISDDDGYTWFNENRQGYYTRFTLHLEGLNHIYTINDNFYGLTESANVIEMTDGSESRHADFPWNGDQRYRSFVTNSETDPFVLFSEAFGNGRVVLMRKVGNAREEEVDMPFDAHELYIDTEDRLYIHDYTQVSVSEDKGDTWIDLTGNLPDSISITQLDIARDGTVYVASSTTDPYKLRRGILSSSQGPVVANFGERVFPNPAHHLLYLTRQRTEPTRFSILNTMGQAVMQGVHVGQQPIRINSLPSGSFFLRLHGEDQTDAIQFFKL